MLRSTTELLIMSKPYSSGKHALLSIVLKFEEKCLLLLLNGIAKATRTRCTAHQLGRKERRSHHQGNIWNLKANIDRKKLLWTTRKDHSGLDVPLQVLSLSESRSLKTSKLESLSNSSFE